MTITLPSYSINVNIHMNPSISVGAITHVQASKIMYRDGVCVYIHIYINVISELGI